MDSAHSAQQILPSDTVPGRLAHAIRHAELPPHEEEIFRRSIRTILVPTHAGEEECLDVLDLQPKGSRRGRPIVEQSGFGATVMSQRWGMRTKHDQGRRVLAPYNPHGIDTQHVPGFSHAHLRKAAALRTVLDYSEDEELDGVAQSAGCIDMTIAALLEGEKRRLRNIVLTASPCLKEEQWIPLLLRFAFEKLVVSQAEKARRWWQGDSAYLQNRKVNGKETRTFMTDKKRSFEEFAGVVATDLRPMLHRLQREFGVGVALIFAKEDQLFPARKARQWASDAGVPRRNVYMVPGNHSAISDQASDVAKVALGALADLDAQAKLI